MPSDQQYREAPVVLSKQDVHRQWWDSYCSSESEAYHRLAFDWIAEMLNAPPRATIVDLGCGNCQHSIRLAERGFQVEALDIAEPALKEAHHVVRRRGLEASIHIRRGDLTALEFESDSLQYALCWGVLMHIPKVEKAIREIARVLCPGGIVVVSEINMYSLESWSLRVARRLIRHKTGGNKTPAGVEYWSSRPSGTLLTRHANIAWMKQAFEANGVKLKKRTAGHFTELYTVIRSPLLKRCIHGFNGLWLRYVRLPQPTLGNILIFEKMR